MLPSPSPQPTPPHPASHPNTPRRALRPDQQAAVDSGVRGLTKPGARGHIVSACGTGKTLIALRTAEELDAASASGPRPPARMAAQSP
ncbi:DEAD/DEAH box helicase family protein [Streptomyces sp. NPDC017524]|uniref:DEAD/DEAH box helicase family protein n=1 Tax=Streptomyces sp. NPDC017524 TaxID=3364999 RepID=UPI0037A6D474